MMFYMLFLLGENRLILFYNVDKKQIIFIFPFNNFIPFKLNTNGFVVNSKKKEKLSFSIIIIL